MSDRKTAYDAVYACIAELGGAMPTAVAYRNAIIWRAVQAALEAESAMWEGRIRAALENQADRVRALHSRHNCNADHENPNLPIPCSRQGVCNGCGEPGGYECPTWQALEGQ